VLQATCRRTSPASTQAQIGFLQPFDSTVLSPYYIRQTVISSRRCQQHLERTATGHYLCIVTPCLQTAFEDFLFRHSYPDRPTDLRPSLADPDSPIGRATLPSLSLPIPFPFRLLLEVGPLNTARRSGECCKVHQRGLGRIPIGNRIWCILALKSDIWLHQFYLIFLRINNCDASVLFSAKTKHLM